MQLILVVGNMDMINQICQMLVIVSLFTEFTEGHQYRRTDGLVGTNWTKFGSRMQYNTPIMAKWWRSKPEIEFQYGGSSYISAAN